MRLMSVFRKCFREQKRDLWVLGLSLAFAPLFVLIYYLLIGGSGSTSYAVIVINQDQPVARADGSRLEAGLEVVKGLRSFAYKNGSPLLRVVSSDERGAAESQLRDRQAVLALIIPQDFSARLAAYKADQPAAGASVTFLGDLTNPAYSIAAVFAMSVVDEVANSATRTSRPVSLEEEALGASAARSEFENYIPGLLVMAVVLMVFQAAMMPARELEAGALRRLRLTGISAFEYLGGQTLWLALISLVSVVLTFTCAVGLGFRSQGPLWLAAVIELLASLSIIGVGLIVACLSKNVAQAFVIANFPLGLLMFLSGAAFPLPRPIWFSLGGHAFSYADLLPPTHAVLALNKIFTLGAGLGDVVFELGALVILSGLYFFLGVWLFQRTQMRRG